VFTFLDQPTQYILDGEQNAKKRMQEVCFRDFLSKYIKNPLTKPRVLHYAETSMEPGKRWKEMIIYIKNKWGII